MSDKAATLHPSEQGTGIDRCKAVHPALGTRCAMPPDWHAQWAPGWTRHVTTIDGDPDSAGWFWLTEDE